MSWRIVFDLKFNSCFQFFWRLCSTSFVIPSTFTVTLEADFRAISFPIPINTIKISSEIFVSDFFEILGESNKVFLSPFFEWEWCAPRSHGHSNCNTMTVNFCEVSNKLSSSGLKIFTIKTEWKLPSLNLTTSICVVFAWCEPVMWVSKLDVSEEWNLIYWRLGQGFYSYLFVWAIYFESEGLSDITSVSPHELFLSIYIVGDSSMGRW